MNCFSRDELHDFLEGSLIQSAETELAGHLESCPECRRLLDELSDDQLVRGHMEATRREAAQVQVTSDGENRWKESTAPGRSPVLEDEIQLPVEFGKFVLREALGSGGFGTVYLADDTELQREVAVKIPHLGGLSPAIRRRFVREGTATASLHHPHIVHVHQAGENEGVCFLVSEYIPGHTLRQFLNEGSASKSPKEAALIVLALTEAVGHAHQNGVVHRDIKPENVILDCRTAHGELEFCPKLTDFGTARLVGVADTRTASGMLIGTIPYMSPEQISGQSDIGPASDIYALGALLYELISGDPPLRGSNNIETLRNVTSTEPVELHRRFAHVTRDFSAICARCLEKNPQRRYGSAEQLAVDLQRFLKNEPTLARPLGLGPRIWRWSLRNPVPIAVMMTISLMFALLVGGLALHTRRLQNLNEKLKLSNQQASEMWDRAERSKLRARRLAYASDIRLAAKCWRDGDSANVRDILARYGPGTGQSDIRGIEWYFLERTVQPKADTIAQYGAPLYCLRLSPDQTSFATAGQDGIIRIHDRATGVVRRCIDSGQLEVNGVAFSPNGELLASAGDDGSVCVWEVANGKRQERFVAHDGLAFGLEFTPGGGTLVSCGTDGFVHVWKNGRKLVTHRDHASRVEALAISPDGRWLASVGKDRTLVVRDMDTNEVQLRWSSGQGTLSSVAFGPDSRILAIAEASGETKSLRLFDVMSGVESLTRLHPDGICSVTFCANGDRVLTADNAGAVRIWDISDRPATSRVTIEPVQSWQAHNARAYAVAVEPEGSSVLTVGHDGKVRRLQIADLSSDFVLDTSSLSQSIGLDEKELLLHSVAFHPTNDRLFVAAHVGIAIIKANGNEAIEFERGSGNRSWDMVAMPEHRNWIAVAGSMSHQPTSNLAAVVKRWTMGTGQAHELFRTQPNCSIDDLSCSPAGDLVAVVINDLMVADAPKRLLLIDSSSGSVLNQFPAATGTMPRFTRDGLLLVFGVQSDIHIVNLHTQRHRVIREAHLESQNGLAITGDGKLLATCDESREIRIWDLATLQRCAVLKGHQGMITALQFTLDSRTLLSSSFDGTVKAWSVATGQHLMDVHIGSGGVNHMALSNNGSRMAIVEDRKRIRVLPLGRMGP